MGLLEGIVDLSCFSPLFYFLLGVCATIYFMLLLRSDKKTKMESADTKVAIKFYLNMFVLNKEEALQSAIKMKMKDRPKLISGLASSLANNLISEDKFVSGIGDKISALIPVKLEEMGIKSVVEKAYANGNFVCVTVNIISADARKVIEKKGGKAKLIEYDGFLDMFGVPQLNTTIDDTLAQIIGEKMQENFPATLREKMKDKIGLELKISACSESEQASFFLKTLKEMKKKGTEK